VPGAAVVGGVGGGGGGGVGVVGVVGRGVRYVERRTDEVAIKRICTSQVANRARRARTGEMRLMCFPCRYFTLRAQDGG
jgi:hypothetical protein